MSGDGERAKKKKHNKQKHKKKSLFFDRAEISRFTEAKKGQTWMP